MKLTCRSKIFPALFSIAVLVTTTGVSPGQPSTFTYQGQLTENGITADGLYDLRFTVFDSATTGTSLGVVTNTAAVVSNGLFTVQIEFGAGVFDGSERWLEIGAVTNGGGSFTVMSPRQRITSTPYAITAGNLTGALPAGGLSGTYGQPVSLTNQANELSGSFTGDGSGLSGISSLDAADGAPQNVVRVDNEGKVGINVASPQFGLLEVEQSADNQDSGLAVVNTSRQRALRLWADGSNNSRIDSGSSGNSALLLNGAGAGNIGIGTTDPDGRLDIEDALHLQIDAPGVGNWSERLFLAEDSSGDFGFSLIYAGSADPTFNATQIPLDDNAFYIVRHDGSASGVPAVAIRRNTGSVGVGTSQPDNTLHVHKGSAGSVTANGNAPLVVENDTTSWISILSPSANERGVLFGDDLNGSTAGGVVFNSSATPNGMQFRTGGNVTRMAIESGGDVGIGTTSPQAKLHVAGNARIDGSITIPTTTRYLSMSAGGFSLHGNLVSTPIGGDSVDPPFVYWDTSGSSEDSWAMDRIDLPDGAVVTRLEATVNDSDPGENVTVRLSRASSTGTSNVGTLLASVGSTLSPGTVTLSTTSIANATIDNQNYTYYLMVEFPDTAFPATLRAFYKARITYTITSPLP